MDNTTLETIKELKKRTDELNDRINIQAKAALITIQGVKTGFSAIEARLDRLEALISGDDHK